MSLIFLEVDLLPQGVSLEIGTKDFWNKVLGLEYQLESDFVDCW